MTRHITIFGSSRIPNNDPQYIDIQQLANAIGQRGWHGIVGGHQGAMAAFSQGMREAGAHVRGYTVSCFPTPSNHTLTEEISTDHFFQRMQLLIEEADAYLVLPGGLGTLAELAMVWDLLAIGALKARPCILYGDQWPAIIAILNNNLYLSVDHAAQMLTLCTTHDEVLAHLT
ncbi:MAG: LOG family protein [Zetaproteobacteria bacterium]|nr:LOG family protein [Zetaproteobacteria bacterium]